VADRLADAGAAVFNVAVDAWDVRPGLPKALVPIQAQVEYLLRRQYLYGYMVFFNINICRNNHDDVRRLTEWAHQHRIATDYHINETPMLEQDAHFQHLEDNPTYIRPEDWRAVDSLVDWIIEKNQAGYQMVNSVQRLREMKTFVRMASGADLHRVGWYGDGSGDGDFSRKVSSTPGIEQEPGGGVHFSDWNCRAGQNSLIIRTDGTVAPCFPLYSASHNWGNIDEFRFQQDQLDAMKRTCQRHCFSTLNHNLGYCYNDRRVLKVVWQQARRGFKGGARSFDD
jgi:radical SAM protein with 4Fe4S-binding SPASM domain